MVVLFLADDGTFKAVSPEQLQLRQLEPGSVGLGFSVSVPTDVDKEPEVRFQPFITFNGVTLTPEKNS